MREFVLAVQTDHKNAFQTNQTIEETKTQVDTALKSFIIE